MSKSSTPVKSHNKGTLRNRKEILKKTLNNFLCYEIYQNLTTQIKFYNAKKCA